MRSIRFKSAYDFRVHFWAWNSFALASRSYYDGWINQINFGLICFSWMTPPKREDLGGLL
jgi:hypothetical protein